jgi:hypothetical protein
MKPNNTLLDAAVPHKFFASLPAALERAEQEAVDTGGIVLQVRSIAIEPGRLVATGLIPSKAVIWNEAAAGRFLQPRSTGNLYLTWGSLIQPKQDIGYLVVQVPVIARQLPGSEDGAHCWASVAIPRSLSSLQVGIIGARCCSRCNRPIAPERLKALPTTRVCILCQQQKETE